MTGAVAGVPGDIAGEEERRDAPALVLPDGTILRGRSWPANVRSRGTVVVVHGLGEHVGRYAPLARSLNGLGLDVRGFDQRGHGRSDGARGRIPRDDTLLDDLAAVLDHARTAHRGGAFVLLGHSLGGAVVARFVAEALAGTPRPWSRPIDHLVLSSPALATHVSRPMRALAGLLGRWLPDLPLGNGLSPDWLSRDPAVVSGYRADPLVHDRIAPRLARFLFTAGGEVRALAPRWRMPTTLFWSGADRCVAPHGSAAFLAAAPAGLVRGACFPGLFHEIFNEPEHDAVFAALAASLEAALEAALDNPSFRQPDPHEATP